MPYDLSEVNPDLLNYRLNAYRNAPDVVSMEDWLFEQAQVKTMTSVLPEEVKT